MTRQIPAERPLENKQSILDEVLDDAVDAKRRRGWLLPVAAAASIAVVATGALTLPSLLASDNPGPEGTASAGTPAGVTTKAGSTPSVKVLDRGKLSPAEATAFATECAKWIGSKDIPGQNFGDAPLNWPGAGAKIDKILHATKIAGRAAGTTDWTVAVRSGGQTWACVGRLPTVDSTGRVLRGYSFGAVSMKHADGQGGGALNDAATRSMVRMSSSRWLVGPAAATEVQERLVLNGKAGPWYASAVVDGLSYIQLPQSGPMKLGDKIRIETRMVDAAGQPVTKPMAENHQVIRTSGGYLTIEPIKR
jgi:hypothetical protein